jgi:hypothetical protein
MVRQLNLLVWFLLIMIIAEFQLLIGLGIPRIVNLLKHSDWSVRFDGSLALSKLSKQCKTANSLGLPFL